MSPLPRLQAIEALSQVPTEQLQWLIDQGEVISLPIGGALFSPGQDSLHLYILLEGKIRVFFSQNGDTREVATLQAGDITGVLPYSRLKRAAGYGTALTEAKLLQVHKEVFPEMIRTHYTLTEALVHFMTNRVRDFTSLQQQSEKLMALGKLSAGLAHELNNPSAAVVRSAHALRRHLGSVPDKFKQVIALRLEPAQVDPVNDLLFQHLQAGPGKLRLVERQAREDELADWYEDHGLEVDEDQVETWVEYGFGEEDLEQILDIVGEDYLPPVLNWLLNVLDTERLTQEIEEAARRISELVTSVKAYTHMDQNQDRQTTDLHQGLQNTVTMLKHKFRQNQVQLKWELSEDLPAISAFPSELNQVWTNLIDNALDAMEDGGGTLTLATSEEGACVLVKVIDSGPGIPAEIQPRIFDPFYTTKSMGKGTGMGLDVVQKILFHHRADLKLFSEPGHTEFRITLPKG